MPDNNYRNKGKRQSNVSLPEKVSPQIVTASTAARRNSVMENKPKKKPPRNPLTPTIPEDDSIDVKIIKFTVEDESKKLSRKTSVDSRSSTTSGKSKVSNTYENKAFEGNLRTNNDGSSSVRSASRPPSLHSIDRVYREQYCCCAKRTKCERSLLITVSVLSIIIIVLVIIVVVLARHNKLDHLLSTLSLNKK